MEPKHAKLRLAIEIVGFLAIMALMTACFGIFYWGKTMQMDCPNFAGDTAGAQSALRWGNHHLDGDKDGIACE